MSQPPTSSGAAGNAPGRRDGASAEGVSEHDWLIELQNEQLRSCAADVVAAVAHALGSPLNVISGRAEMLRRDPANYDAQLTRIEQQVQKLANGMRELVDYLALAEPPKDVVSAEAALGEVVAQLRPFAERSGVELRLRAELGSVLADRRHVRAMLTPLLAFAIRRAARSGPPSALRASARLDGSMVVFELEAPGIGALEGWQLEHFQPRPKSEPEACQVLSVCGALARGRGGRLQLEVRPSGDGAESALLRWSFRPEKA